MRLVLAFFSVANLALLASPVEEARRLFDQKRVPEAEPVLVQWVQSHPEDVDALILLGNCQSLEQKEEAALASFSKAVDLAPDRSDALTAYGVACMMAAGRDNSLILATKGRRALEKACSLDPRNGEAHEALILFYGNAPWIAGGDMDKAYAHARALTEVNAQHGLVQMITLLTKEHKYKEAFVLLDKALASAPDDYLTLYALGRIASMSGERLDDGLRALQRCLSMDVPKTGANHAGVQYRMGLILKLQGKKANAEQCFDEALKLEGDNKFFAEQVRKARQT